MGNEIKPEHTRVAVAEADGTRQTLDEWTHYTLYEPVAGPSRRILSRRVFKLAGEDCELQQDGQTFKVTRTGEILRRV